jgi:hypothetical protein
MDPITPPDGGEKTSREIRCFSCRHFHITYDAAFPYGCRAARFKSRLMPATEMVANSGLECQLFEAKGKRRRPPAR